LALLKQILQIADNFLSFSQRGMSSRMFVHPFFCQVPFKADKITILPLLAAFSQKLTISSKNYPSSIPMTSKLCQRLPNSLNVLAATAVFYCLSCVDMHSPVCSLIYLLSAEYLMLRHFFPEISNLFTLLSSSVLFPANMGPIISSILPLCGNLLRFWIYRWSI